MPTYTYHCSTCKHIWDETRPIEDRATPANGCPVCTNDYVTRIITTPGIQFKGPGFYTTDKRN